MPQASSSSRASKNEDSDVLNDDFESLQDTQNNLSWVNLNVDEGGVQSEVSDAILKSGDGDFPNTTSSGVGEHEDFEHSPFTGDYEVVTTKPQVASATTKIMADVGQAAKDDNRCKYPRDTDGGTARKLFENTPRLALEVSQETVKPWATLATSFRAGGSWFLFWSNWIFCQIFSMILRAFHHGWVHNGVDKIHSTAPEFQHSIVLHQMYDGIPVIVEEAGKLHAVLGVLLESAVCDLLDGEPSLLQWDKEATTFKGVCCEAHRTQDPLPSHMFNGHPDEMTLPRSTGGDVERQKLLTVLETVPIPKVYYPPSVETPEDYKGLAWFIAKQGIFSLNPQRFEVNSSDFGDITGGKRVFHSTYSIQKTGPELLHEEHWVMESSVGLSEVTDAWQYEFNVDFSANCGSVLSTNSDMEFDGVSICGCRNSPKTWVEVVTMFRGGGPRVVVWSNWGLIVLTVINLRKPHNCWVVTFTTFKGGTTVGFWRSWAQIVGQNAEMAEFQIS